MARGGDCSSRSTSGPAGQFRDVVVYLEDIEKGKSLHPLTQPAH